MKKERKLAIKIISEFEDLLEQKDIYIPSEDRTGDESEARIYGTEYYQLEDRITEILHENSQILKLSQEAE